MADLSLNNVGRVAIRERPPTVATMGSTKPRRTNKDGRIVITSGSTTTPPARPASRSGRSARRSPHGAIVISLRRSPSCLCYELARDLRVEIDRLEKLALGQPLIGCVRNVDRSRTKQQRFAPVGERRNIRSE